MKRTSKNYFTKEESVYYNNEYKNYLIEHKGVKHLDALLLDSSLISTTGEKIYCYKLVDCGKYKQLYIYEDYKIKKCKEFEKDHLDINYLFKKENYKNKDDKKLVELKNINRTKFKLQRLVKANEDIFKTFITLTFDKDVIDINEANKRFKYWRDIFQRKYKNFKYICVPEFQKNGKVHYHLLTNLDYNDVNFINENISFELLKNKLRSRSYKLINYSVGEIAINKVNLNDLDIVLRKIDNKWDNTKKTYNYKSKSYKVFKTIKYWNNGFSNVINMNNQNVIGYISKYMTKDIDNRLFGKKRYLFSLSLIIPREYFFADKTTNELWYMLNLVNDSDVTYQHNYLNKFGEEIKFIEYKVKQ